MLNADLLESEKEDICDLVAELPAHQQERFYEITRQSIRDPDTYAVLNYVAPLGLHHFYIGRWVLGIWTLLATSIGVATLFVHILIGLIILIAVALCELINLFQSQNIIQHHNNQMSRQALKSIRKFSA